MLGSLAGGGDSQSQLAALVSCAEEFTSRVDLRRVDAQADRLHASLLLDLPDPTVVGQFIGAVDRALPGSSVTIIEASGLD